MVSEADAVPLTITPDLAARLLTLANDQQMTLFSVLKTALAILVARTTASRDVVVGSAAPDGTVIPLRVMIDPWGSVADALCRVRDAVIREHIVEADENVVVLLAIHDVPGSALRYAAPPFELSVTFVDAGAGCNLEATLLYDASLFEESSIVRLGQQWDRLLRAIAEGPHQRVCDLNLMSDDERDVLLAAGDRSGEAAPFVPVTELVAKAAMQHSAEIAIEYGDQRLAYHELARLACHLAQQLSGYGVQRGDVVAVFLDRGLELVIAQLAVMGAGAVLLPLDTEQPPQRIDTMLSDSRARLVLSDDAGAVGLASMLPVLDVVTALAGAPDASLAPPAFVRVTPADGSYALFTSGSTGRPKGVVNTHGGIANRIAWMQDTYRLTPSDRVLYKTPVSFDVAMWEWLWPLTTGARLVVAEAGDQRDPIAIARTIREHGVTFTHFVPSMLRLFTAQPEARDCRALRQIVCSGEELTPVAVDEAFKICPAVDNLYGPTEAAIDVTWWACQPGADRTPIGRPISGVCLRVVDETGALVPVGVPGELLVGGVALARGYTFRPGLTARAFIPDRWSDGRRLYRSGDRVRWREPGVLEFLGRMDAQVKIRGVRVEPGEVEMVLGAFPGVLESVVVVPTDERRGPQLAAYVTGSAATDALRRYLRSALPEVMVPHQITRLDEMPRTPNGKIDRAGLARIAAPQ